MSKVDFVDNMTAAQREDWHRRYVKCDGCGNYHNRNQEHYCVVYNGPVCETPGCNEKTVFTMIGAPGSGQGLTCRAGHYHGTRRELTLEDVI